MSDNPRPSKTAYILAVEIEVLLVLLKEKRDLVEAAFAGFPTEEQVYADESGAKDTLVSKAQDVRGYLLEAVADIDEFLNRFGVNESVNLPVGLDDFKKIAEAGG